MNASTSSQSPKKNSACRRRKRCLLALPSLAMALAAAQTGQTATYTWSGATNTAMSGTAANWGGTVPGSGDTALWNSATYTNQPNANADLVLGELYFGGNSGNVTFGSGTGILTLNGISTTGTNFGVELSGTGVVTTGSARFALGADQTWLNNSTGSFTVPGAITNSSASIARTLTVDGGGVTALNGVIKDNGTGTVAIVKTGTGTLNLGVANTFSGGLTIKQGTVATGITQGFGGGTITLGDTSGSSNATLLETGNTTGPYNFNNNIIVPAGSTGTLAISSSGGTTLSGAITLNHDLTLGALYAGRIFTVSGLITGSNTLSIIGQNTYSRVYITGNNGSSYTGSVVVNPAGGLSFSNHGLGDGSATITLAGGILEFLPGNTQDIGSRLRTSGNTALQIATGSNAVVFGSPLTDASLTKGLTVTGGGSLTLTGSNTYTGTTTVGTSAFGGATSIGVVKLAGDGGSILSGNALTTGSLGTFDLNGNSQTLGLLNNSGVVTNSGTGTPTLTIGNGSTGAGTLTGTMNVVWNQGATNSILSGTIANVGTVTLNGTGAGTMTLTGSNTFSGGATLSAGRLLVGNANALGPGTFTLTSGTVSSSGTTAYTIANPLSFAGNFGLGDTSATYNGALTFNGNGDLSGAMRSFTVNSPVTLAGAISNGGLTKAGNSILTLSGSSTFAGGTVLSAGRLQVANANALGSGTLTLTTGTFSSSDTTPYLLNNPLAVTGAVGLGDATNNGALTFGGNVDLTSGTRTLTVNSPVTISGTIGNGGLTKAGLDTLTLTGASTYSGLTTISAGALQLGDGTAGHDGSLATSGIANSVQLRFNLFGDQSVGYPISGGGTVWKQGGGTLILTASNNIGAVTVFGGALQFGDGTAGHDGSITAGSGLTNSGTLIYNLSGVQSASYAISGSGSLTKTGAGLLTLSGVNSYSGGTSINSGTLSVASLADSGTSNLGTSGTLAFGGGTLQCTGASGSTSRAVILNAGGGTIDTTTSGTLTLSANISGIGGVAKSGSGTLTLTGSNSYGGNTIVSGGRLQIPTADALGTGTLTLAGGNLSATGTTGFTISNPLSFSGDGGLGHATNNGPLTFSGAVNLTGGMRTLTINSPVALAGAISNGALTKSGASTLTLSASNSFTGGVTIANGRLQMANPGALGAGPLALTGGTLCSADATGYSIGNPLSISGSAGLGDAVNNGALTFSGDVDLSGSVRTLSVNSPVTMTGVISNGGLTKSGAGVLTLTGSNTYTGVTTISQGMLNVAGAFALPNWNVPDSLVVSSGATLSVSNAFADADIATLIATGSNFRAGAAIGLDTTAGDRTYAITLSNSPQGALGLSKLGANTLILTASNTYTGATTIASGTLQVGDGISEASIASTSGITNNGALAYTVLGSQSLSGAISGTGSVTKIGAGTLDLHTSNPFSGGLVIKQGTVSTTYGYSQGLGSGTITLGDTFGSANATLFVNPGGSGTTTYTNPIVVQAGSTGALALSTTNASVTFSGPVALNHDLTVACLYQRNLTLAGTITGDNTLVFQGYNMFAAVSLTGSNGNSFTGNSVVNSGNLAFGNHSLGDGSGTITLAGGILNFLPGNTQDIGSRLRTSGATALQLVVNGNDVIFGSPLTDASLTKGLTVAGGGSLTLTGSNTYTGTTTIGSPSLGSGVNVVGSLKLAASGASILSGNALTTSTAGTFDLNGNSQTLGLLNNAGIVTNSGTGTPTLTIGGASTGAGTFTGPMNIVWNQGPTSSTYSGNIASTGNLTLNAAGAGSITLSGSNSYSGSTTVSAGSINVNGASGALVNTGTIAIFNGASMTIGDNANALANRINDSATVSLGGGNFILAGKNNTATTETVGVLSIAAGGQSTLTSNIGTGSTAVLTFNGTNVVRSGTGGTVAFAGTGAILMPNGTLSNSILGGWGWMGGSTTNVTGAPATLVGGTVSALTNFDKTYTAATTTGVNDWTDGQNVLLDTTTPAANVSVTLGASLSVNSLTIRTTNTPTLNLGGFTLTLTSGGLFLPTSGAAKNLSLSNGTLTAGNGSAPAELFINDTQGHASAIPNISAVIADNNGQAVSVVKGGNAQNCLVLLSGTNTYSGGTYINSHLLVVNGDSNLGATTGAIYFQGGSLRVQTTGTFNANRNLVIAAGNTGTLDTYYGALAGNVLTVAGRVTGAGSFTKGAIANQGYTGDTGPLAGTVILANTANDWAGATTVSAGVLQIGDGVTTNGSIPDRQVSLAGANTTLRFANPGAMMFNSLISGTGDLIKTGAGTLTLGASNSFVNGTTISGGILAISSDASLGAAYDGTVSGATVTRVGSGYLSGGTYTSWAPTFSAPPSGATATGTATSAFILNSSGQLFKVTGLTGGSGYVAPPTVTVGGSGTGGAIQAYVKGLLTLDGGTLQTTAGISSARAVYITSNNGAVDTNGFDSTFSGIVNGPGGLTKAGAGTLALSGSNTYSGGTTIGNGTVRVGNASALGTGGLTVNGGTLDLNGNSLSVTNLSGAGGRVTSTGSGTSTLTATVASGTSGYAGDIINGTGAVALEKQGAGTLALSGSLKIAALNATDGVTALSQTASIGAIAIGSGGTLSIAAHSGSTWSVIDTSALAFSGTTGNIDLGAASAVFDDLQVNGVMTSMVYDNSELYLDTFAGVGGLDSFYEVAGDPIDFNQVLLKTQVYDVLNGGGSAVLQETAAAAAPVSPEAVPEPGLLGLVLTGALSLFGFRRNRGNRA